jgi:hypothetical protein
MPNPLIAQGSLNRLRGSVIITNLPQLTVTASYLGKAGISLSIEGKSTDYIETMAGAVTSPKILMMVTVSVALLKTQALASQYQAQMQSDARIGPVTIKADALTLSDYDLNNCTISSVREMSFAGEDPVYMTTLEGYWLVNSALWDAV